MVLAANAVLLNFFTAAAYGLDGFAHAAEADGRPPAVGARDRPGFRRRGAGEPSPTPPCWRVVMTLAFAVLGGLGVRLMTGLWRRPRSRP